MDPLSRVGARLILRLIVIAVLEGLMAAPAGALDFQLHTVSVAEDGFTHEHSCFKYDDVVDVMIDLPRGWTVTADAGSITSVPPNDASTLIRLEKSRLAPNIPFRDAGLEAYRKVALATVPAGAVDVRIVKEAANPLPVFNWKDFEFEVTYTFFGVTLRRSVLFINLNSQQQILTTVISGPLTFDKVHGAAMDVMRSWSPVPPHR
jgi:hypothetical protein